jgi:hypothetical protein
MTLNKMNTRYRQRTSTLRACGRWAETSRAAEQDVDCVRRVTGITLMSSALMLLQSMEWPSEELAGTVRSRSEEEKSRIGKTRLLQSLPISDSALDDINVLLLLHKEGDLVSNFHAEFSKKNTTQICFLN